MIIREFGVDWIIRSDTGFSPYSVNNVKVSNQASPVSLSGAKILPGTRRISLSAPEFGAACIMTKDVLGYGTYEVYLIGRMDAFDPNINSAVWTHNDYKPYSACTEVDFEFSPWGDQNRRSDRVQLGIFVNQERPPDPSDPKKLLYPSAVLGAPSYLYHRITIVQLPNLSRVKAAGWWSLNDDWHDYAYRDWEVPTPEMGQFKIGIMPVKKDVGYMLPKSASVPAKIVVAGFTFTPG